MDARQFLQVGFRQAKDLARDRVYLFATPLSLFEAYGGKLMTEPLLGVSEVAAASRLVEELDPSEPVPPLLKGVSWGQNCS